MFPHSPLSDEIIRDLEPKAKDYKVGVERSLYILVTPTRGKYWRFKYRVNGKEKTLSIGSFPDVSLKDAIHALNNAKAMLREGIDPGFAKQEAKRMLPSPKLKHVPLFHMDISVGGRLTLQVEKTSLTLSKSQTDALRTFLNATPVQEEDVC